MGPPGETTTLRGTTTTTKEEEEEEEKALEDDDFASSSFFGGGGQSSKGAFLRDDGNEYEPPFGLRSVESISVRRLNALDSFYREEEEDDDDVVDDDDDGETREESANRTTAKAKRSARGRGFKNIASQLNSIEVYFTLKRIVKDSSVFLGGEKSSQNSIRTCDDQLKVFISKAISFAKDNKSVCDPDWDIFEKEQRRFREMLERDDGDGENVNNEEDALVPGLFEFAVYGRRIQEEDTSSSCSSSDDEYDEEGEKKQCKTFEDTKEKLLHKALISFQHVKRATAQLERLSQSSRVPVVVLRVKSSRRNGTTTYYVRDIRDLKEYENLDVREKLLSEEESLHEMYNNSHHNNNAAMGGDNDTSKDEDGIDSETDGGIVITDDILTANKKKGRTKSLDESELMGLSTQTPKTTVASASPFSSPFRRGAVWDGANERASSPSKTKSASNNKDILDQSVQKLNTENALESISKAMLASARREKLQQRRHVLQLKMEEELRSVRRVSQKTQFLFEIENKRALSERKAEELKRALENGRKQSTWLEKLVSVKTESIRTKREALVRKRRDLDELKMHLEGPEIDGTLRRTISALQNRRWQLVRDLAEAFPTKKVGQQSTTITRPWAICGLKLDLADRLLGPSDSIRKQHQKQDQQQRQMHPQNEKGMAENEKSRVSKNADGTGSGLEDMSTRNNANDTDKSAGNQLFQTLATLFGYEDDEDEEFLNASEAESRDGRSQGGKKNTNATDYAQFHSSAARDDAEVAAAALGTVCLLVARLSSIFDIPSRYPLAFGSSRSFVGDLKEIKRDHDHSRNSSEMGASQNGGDDNSPNVLGSPQRRKSSSITLTKWRRVEFPLFLDDHAKATGDARRFAYGVFLLNKNVQQILDAYGLESRGPRKTLENVARLFQYATKISRENSSAT